MLTVLDLQTLASFGGGMIIDAKRISANDLKTIVSFGNAQNISITIKNASIIPINELKTIASFSKGSVIFDFCN
ncbi:hypothetical protein ACRZOS_000167 [Enterobacter kobei]